MTDVIEGMLSEAWQKGATDVHLAVGAYPFMRIGGKLEPFGYEKLNNDVTLDFVLLTMPESARAIFEEKGEYTFSLDSCVGRVRVTAYSQLEGVALSFRLQQKYEELSGQYFEMPESVWRICERQKGLVLVTGAAGSGKTTTLAALLKKINEEQQLHVVTLERPVEYIHPHRSSLMNQRELGSVCEDGAEGIAHALRADADVILLSELKGAAMTEAALCAAEAGALVLVEMNAGSPVGALEQLIDGFELSKQKRIRERLMNALEAIVFQQLLPDAEGKQRAEYKVVESKKQ